MTGFGRGEASDGDFHVVAEMRSLNHRFLDIVVRLPREYGAWEEVIAGKIKERINRGRVEVFINLLSAPSNSRGLFVDKELALAYYRCLEELRQLLGISEGVSLDTIAAGPEIFRLESDLPDLDAGRPVLEEAVLEALNGLETMRSHEGENLARGLRISIGALGDSCRLLRQRAPELVAAYRERTQARVEEYLGGAIERDRVLAEVVLFAERSNIDEELERLDSHLVQLAGALETGSPTGRRLEFILQEMVREVNTIGSKVNDPQVGETIVEMKNVLESMREQAQNIE